MADAMLISQLARRSGIPATTLRYYESQGLLPAAARTPAGYRTYDQDAIDRLRFVTTAKRLGLELPEIRALLVPWEHGTCRQVRTDLTPMLDARLAQADRHAADLDAFRARLARARRHLDAIDRDGPCDSGCSFLRLDDPAVRAATGSRPDDPPIACSLTATDHAERARRWHAVLDGATGRRPGVHGVTIEFDDRVDLGELAQVARAEARCCPFLTLTVRFAPAPALVVEAPPEAAALVGELFGGPDREPEPAS